jgi:hypothetical protein
MTTTERQLLQRAETAEKNWRKLEEELPEMRKQNKRLTAFLQDAAAYLRVTDTDGAITQLSTLRHDILGLANDEPCFLPRVSGYAEAERINNQ